MKKLLYRIVFILGLFASLSVSAQDQEARKTIQKSYSASGMTFKVSNSFGKVHINTNNGSKIEVKVDVVAKASTKAKAEEVLNAISIVHTQSANLIAFETVLDKMSGWSWGGSKNFEINYTIDMPATTPVEVSNKYGNTYLANHSGKAVIQNSYGNLKTEKMTGSQEKSLVVKYGNAQINYIEQGSIKVAYGRLDLGSAGNVIVKSAYSNTEIGKVTNLNLDNAYSNIEIESVEKIEGDTDYASKFIIRSLSKSLNLTGSYNGSLKVEGIEKSCQEITINTKYNTCILVFKEDAGCQFELDLKYGSLMGEKEKFTIQNKTVESSSSFYVGKFGKSNQTKVKIVNKYGDVKIR